jgi:hypothetical protein
MIGGWNGQVEILMRLNSQHLRRRRGHRGFPRVVEALIPVESSTGFVPIHSSQMMNDIATDENATPAERRQSRTKFAKGFRKALPC